WRLASNFLHAYNALRRGHVSQSWTGYHIPYGIISRHVGLIELIYLDFTSVYQDPYILQAAIFHIGYHTYCRQDYIASQCFFTLSGFYGHYTSFAFGIDSCDLSTGHDFYPCFLIQLFKAFRNFFILIGNDPVQEFNNGHLSAYAVVEVCKFYPYSPGSYYNQFLRLFIQGHGFSVADDFFVVNL